MRRIYIEDNFLPNKVYSLSKDNAHYISRVLRLKEQDILEIFNNTNYIFLAEIIYISRENIQFKIFQHTFKNIESPLHIHLGQVISKHNKMDITIQKSIEMGVNIITPLFSENCNIKKNINFSNKIKRWKKIAISACQQCNRNILPEIKNPQDIFAWCKKNNINDIKIILDPKSKLTFNQLPKSIRTIKILIGSEGGFSDKEIHEIIQHGFISVKLGPRILRTETASIAAISALQTKFGDFY